MNIPTGRLRIPFAVITILVTTVLFASLITTLGSGTVLAADTAPPRHVVQVSDYTNTYDMNAVAERMMNDGHHALLTTSMSFYRGSKFITVTVARTGSAIVQVSMNTWRPVSYGLVSAAHSIAAFEMTQLRAIGGAAVQAIRLPGILAGNFMDRVAIEEVIRPSTDKPLPVIDAETSEKVLARLSGQRKEYVAQRLAEQYTANQLLDGSVIAGDPTHGGYPAKWDTVFQDSTVDNWGMYNRECVSYAAWKVHQTYGYMPYWGGIGNANQWIRNARSAGIPTSTIPKAGTVAISMNGYYGHAMWVEAVAGNMIYVSQYNYDLRGHYSEMWVSADSFTYIYFK